MKKKCLQLMTLGAFWLPLSMGDSQAKPCGEVLDKCINNKKHCNAYADSGDAKKACNENFNKFHNYQEACKAGCSIFWEEGFCSPGPLGRTRIL